MIRKPTTIKNNNNMKFKWKSTFPEPLKGNKQILKGTGTFSRSSMSIESKFIII